MSAPQRTQMPTTPSVEDADVSAAKARVGQPARDRLVEIRSFVQRAEELLATPSQLRQSATQQVGILTNQQAQAEMLSKPVTELRDMAGKGARLNTLAEAGFRTVADVAAARPQRLQTIQGIGPQTAHQVTVAAQQLWSQISTQTRFRFHPDNPGSGEAGYWPRSPRSRSRTGCTPR